MRSRFVLIPLLLLAACINQSSIQSRYSSDHGTCQSYAERNIDHYLPKDHPVSEDDRNAELVTLFSDCMGKKGWQVAKPKRSDEANNTGNSIPPEPSPAAAKAAEPGQQPAQQPVHPEPTPLSPGLSQPTGGAVYEPTYGTGPGRNF